MSRKNELKSLSEIPIGGSEDETKLAVTSAFNAKAHDSWIKGLSTDDIAELDRLHEEEVAHDTKTTSNRGCEMGIRDNTKARISIPNLAGENGENLDCPNLCRELTSYEVSDSDKEEGDSRMGGYFELMESQDCLCGNKL